MPLLPLCFFQYSFDDNLREKLCFTQCNTAMAAWLFHNFFIYLHNQLSSIHFIITYYRVQMFQNCDYQIDSKNGWLFLSASFTAKAELVFVLTLKNAFPQRFYFEANIKTIGSSKNPTRDFQNRPLLQR